MPNQISWILASVTLAFLPSYTIRFNIAGFPTTVLELLILITLLAWVTHLLRLKSTPQAAWQRVHNPLLWMGLSLVVVALLEALVAPDKKSGLGLWRAYFAEPFIFGLIILEISRRVKAYRWIFYSLLVPAVVLSIIGICQVLVGQPTTADSLHEVLQGRAAAVFNSANALALYLGPIFGLGLFVAMRTKRWLWLPVTAIFTAIWMTRSEGARIGLGAVETLVISGFFWPRIPSGIKIFFWRALPKLAIVALVLAAALFVNISSFAPRTHFTYPRTYHDTKTIRLCLWEGTKQVLLGSPLIGTGLSGFHSAYEQARTCDSELLEYPHNIFLNFWTQTGLLGLLLYLLIQGRIFKILIRSKERAWGLGLAAGFSYFILHGLVDVPYFKNDLAVEFWAFAMLAVLIAESTQPTLEN